jgi:hypothetical protein
LTDSAEDILKPADRGVPLVATWPRWAASTAALGAAFVAVVEGYLLFTHSTRTLASFAPLVGITCVLGALLLLAILRAEESRLARELRTARTGTAVLRGIVLRRRQQAPFVGRLLSTRLGTAAVLLADGDRSGALDALAAGSPLMQGGRLEKLRAVIDADVERAAGNSVGLERCVQRLRAMERIGNREGDLYRLHVLVKALLEQADGDGAYELVEALAQSTDEDERVYLAWLRVWFDIDAETAGYRDAWPAIPEGELRMATLLARAHGAEKLVEKLEERVGAIARPERPQ